MQSHAHHPHATQQMVSVGMGNKQVVDIFTPHTSTLQLSEHTIAPTGIHHQHCSIVAMQCEAGVVASGSKCVTRSKHGDVVIVFQHFVKLEFNFPPSDITQTLAGR